MALDLQTPDPERWFHVHATLHVSSAILFHLNQAGLIVHLDRHGPATASEIATACDLVPGVLDVLLDYLADVEPLLTRAPDHRYHLTDFGQRVLQRYGRDTPQGRTFNLFDVRIGAYGPVWANLGALLTGEVVYGTDLVRRGELAAQGVYKVSRALLPSLTAILRRLDAPAAVELGVRTGLLHQLASALPHLALHGLDRDPRALQTAHALASDLPDGWIHWHEADLFDVDRWAPALAGGPPGVLVSLHFHEFLAAGEPALVAWLRQVRERLPGWRVIALEQPRLPPAPQGEPPSILALYNASNLLIHHLIGNGQILTDDAWRGLFTRGGGVVEAVEDTGFLGYQAYVVRW